MVDNHASRRNRLGQAATGIEGTPWRSALWTLLAERLLPARGLQTHAVKPVFTVIASLGPVPKQFSQPLPDVAAQKPFPSRAR